MDALLLQLGGVSNVVVVVRVTTVEHDVVGRQEGDQLGHRLARVARRHHDPRRSRSHELGHELLQAGRARGPLSLEALHGVGTYVVNNTGVAGPHQPAHNIGAHAPEPDHPQLHAVLLRVGP